MITYDRILRPSAGKLLRNKQDGAVGSLFVLGLTRYVRGERMEPPYNYTQADFEEVDDPDFPTLTKESLGLQDGFSYADAKSAVVKTRYSYDDQIALMLNHERDPETYGADYDEMQYWRDIATEVAQRLVEEEGDSDGEPA